MAYELYEITVYTDLYHNLNDLFHAFRWYGATHIKRRQTLHNERAIFHVIAPKNWREVMWKYEPEIMVGTSLQWFNPDATIMNHLPKYYLKRKFLILKLVPLWFEWTGRLKTVNRFYTKGRT